MKKFLVLILCSIMSLSFISCGNSKDKSKETSSKTVKDNKDLNIVAGSIAIAEMLLKLDIKMVGRASTQYGISDEIKGLPEVGLPMSPDLEKIKVLRTDEYITSSALQEMIEDKIKSSGLNVTYCNLDSYDLVKETISDISKKYEKEENGQRLLQEINKKEKEIMKDLDPNKKIKVMILFGAPGHFMLATENSFTGSLITKLGAENISSKTNIRGQYVPFSLETALKENPDVIFRMYHGYIDEAKKQTEEEFKTNSQWRRFKAVQENKIYDLDPKYFGVTGNIEMTESLEKMKGYLYE